MNPDILHPCGRLYMLERSLETMAKTQLDLAHQINELAGHPAVSEACVALSTHAIVMAGTSKRLRELRHELSVVLP
jgi:hypothetical protein